MPNDPIVKVKTPPIKFIPFARSSITEDWSSLAEFYGTVEAVDLVKKRMYIAYQFDGQAAQAAGYRGGAFGSGTDPEFRWLKFITGLSGGYTASNLYNLPLGGQTDWQYKPNAALAGVTPGTLKNTGPDGSPPNVDYNSWIGDFYWDTEVFEASISKWYQWGARKFWLHLPHGKVPGGPYSGPITGQRQNCPDVGMYQPDAYICAKEGFVDAATGRTGNIPMPWLTDDVVDGEIQGFVPLFKALISGSSAGLSRDTWERLTGEGTQMGMWYNPADPIEVTVYNGTINGESYPRWRRWFNASTVLPDTEGLIGSVYARRRLERSLEPYARAGMRIGLDALVNAPGPTVGINGTNGGFSPVTFNGEPYTTAHDLPPAGQTFGNADAGWWKFFSEYVIPTFGKNNIFMEANAGTFFAGGAWQMNPYVLIGGINVCTADEFGRAGIGGTASSPSFAPTTSRQHYLEELGEVEYLNSSTWATIRPHVGSVNTDGVTLLNGKYWYLGSFAEKAGVTDGIPTNPATWYAYNSRLVPEIAYSEMQQGADYLRLKKGYSDPTNSSNGVAGEHIWGHYWAADQLAFRQRIGNGYTFAATQANPGGVLGDPNPMIRDKTRPGIIFPGGALKRTLDSVMPGVNVFGITNDFQRSFSGITAFGKFVAGIKSGKLTLDPLKSNAGQNPATAPNSLPLFPPATSEIVQTVASKLALENRTEGIGGVMWLYPSDYDRYCSTGLGGSLNGVYHVPRITGDIVNPAIFGSIVERKMEQWLDMKIRTWYERFGKYPKYITWKPPAYSGLPNNQQPSWEDYRHLQYTQRIPTTAMETHTAFAVREGYHSKAPEMTADNTLLLQNSGFYTHIPWSNSGQGTSPDPYSQYRDTIGILGETLRLTKAWRTKRGLSSKVGLYQFPFLPQDAYVVYGVSGGAPVVLDSAGWNDLVFPIGSTSTSPNPGGTFGWYTQAQTTDLKNRIKLEYRKRYEPVAKECEVVMPEIFEYSSAEIINDSKNEYYRAWHKEMLNLAYDLKTKDAWDVGGNGQNRPPALLNAEIIPLVTPAYMGVTGDFDTGDPITTQRKTFFDHDKMNHNSIDWIRDEYLRPVDRTPQKVQGMSVWSPYLARALNATRSSAPIAGITTDREWLYKWLKADQGAGITVDWSATTGDMKTKTIQFFDIYRNLSKRYLKRFDAGQPRIDVVADPYKHTPFAVGWTIGYDHSYPAKIDGMDITDVHPLIWVGHNVGTNGFFRTPGDTTGYPGTAEGGSLQLFNDVVTRLKRIPLGRRVILPYFWAQDPISDQKVQIDFYKNTSDGATYTGSLRKRTHETGTVKHITPWAYRQTDDTKRSFQAFLAQCAATGAAFNAIADDGESWVNPSVGSISNSFGGPYGPTGMPAIYAATGGTNHVFPDPSPWLEPQDPRMTTSIVADPRFSTLGNSYDGKTFGGAIEYYYKSMIGSTQIYKNMGIGQGTGMDPTQPTPTDIAGSTPGIIMEYYAFEGPNGISAATGPIGATAYAPPIGANTEYRYNVIQRNSGQAAAAAWANTTPWRNPWSNRYYLATNNAVVNRYIAWYAQTLALENIAMGDLNKKVYIDSIDGSTFEAHRKISYNHYDIFPLGLTEGVFARNGYTHYNFHGDYPFVDASPALYGEIQGEPIDPFSFKNAKYFIFPRSDFERYPLLANNDVHKNPIPTDPNNPDNPYDTYWIGRDLVPTGKVLPFYTESTNTPARSYIAMLMDLQVVRGMLRTNPNSWKGFSPWVWNPNEYRGLPSVSYRFQEPNGEDWSLPNKTDVRYWNELLNHHLLSGAKHFNYFTVGDQQGFSAGRGFTAGLTFMQGVINEWKTVSEGYRVQPASNLDGNISSLVDRVDMSNAGANHAGATGTVISGAKLLKFAREKTAASLPTGTFLWRVTAAPQGTELIRTDDASRVLSDLPARIDLATGEVFAFEKMTRPQSDGTTGNGDFSKFFKNNGYVSLTEAPSEGIILSTSKNIVNSGAELRHAPTVLAKDYVGQPVLLGTGRAAEFTACVNAGTVGIGPTGDWYNGVVNSRAGVCVVGFYQLGNGQALRAAGNITWGLESFVGFYQTGFGWWSAAIWSKQPGTDTIDTVFNENIIGVASYNTLQNLKVTVNGDGTEVKWFADDILKKTYTVSEENRLPIGERAENGLWAGCGVQDITLADSESEAVYPQDGVQRLIVKKLDLRLLTKSDDAKVTVSNRGAWIKRKATSQMPLYRISKTYPAVPTGTLTPGTGFRADPDMLFTPDPNMNPPTSTSDLEDYSDLRVVAAWKNDPIPFDPTPSGTTLTVVAYHPSGIEKVEACLNGGNVVTRLGGQGGGGGPYGEYEFYIPPVSGAQLPLVNLPKTIAGATYGGLHEIRAKVFPVTGRTRILGGEPNAGSRYYTPVDTEFTVKKRDVNETSFFVQNIDTANDPGYQSAQVWAAPEQPSNHRYQTIRSAIQQEMVTSSKKYLDLIAATATTLTIPNIGDEQNITIPGAANCTIRITGHANGTTMAAATSPGDSTNFSTSYNGANIGNIVTNWASAASTTEFSLTNSGLKSYGSNNLDASGGIYRINTQKYNPLSSYNTGMAIAVSPSVNGSNNTDWLFQPVMNKNAWGVAAGAARVGGFLGIGKVKMKNVSFDKGSCPDLFTAASNQAVAFEGVTLMSTLQPSIDPYRIAANGNASFLNCTTHTSGLTVANAFGFSRYVVGCTATGVKGAVFSNASLVRNSSATACNKIEVRTSPAFFSRKGIATPLGAQGKKNNLYLDTVCNGNYADCISLGRNEIKDGWVMDHYDLLYKNLIFTGSTGMIDRIEGGVNGVYMTGISMPNALLFSPNYKAVLTAQTPRFQKMYIDTSSVRMILNEGSTFGNELAAPNTAYKTGFGVQLGSNAASAGFAAEITPRAPVLIALEIKGIPWRKSTVSSNINNYIPGNVLTPWFTITDSAAIKRFGLDMGGGFGPTASGNTPKGLSFGSWSREPYEPAINPRLNWVYSLSNINWTTFSYSGTPAVLGTNNNAYEQWIGDSTPVGVTGYISLNVGLLETFHRSAAKNSTFIYPESTAPKQWLMFHSADTSLNFYLPDSDLWQQNPTTRDVGADPQNFSGNSGHWLNVGNNSNRWMETLVAGINVFGSSAGVAQRGGITFGTFRPAAGIAFRNAMNNGASGGLTLTDQNGNVFRINPASWAASGTEYVYAPGSGFLYASGLCAGFSVVHVGNIGLYPREWSYNGDATNQYAPVKFEINLTNTGLYNNVNKL